MRRPPPAKGEGIAALILIDPGNETPDPWISPRALLRRLGAASVADFLAHRLTLLSLPLIRARANPQLAFARCREGSGRFHECEFSPDTAFLTTLLEIAALHRLAHLLLVDSRALFLQRALVARQIREHLRNGADYTYPFDLPQGLSADAVSVPFLRRMAEMGDVSEPQLSPWIGAHNGIAGRGRFKILDLDAKPAGIESFYPTGRLLVDSQESVRRAERFIRPAMLAAGRGDFPADQLVSFWRREDFRGTGAARGKIVRSQQAAPRRQGRRPISICTLLGDHRFQSSIPRSGIDLVTRSDPARFRHAVVVPGRGAVEKEVRALGVPSLALTADPGWDRPFQGNLDLPVQRSEWSQIARLAVFFREEGVRLLHAHVYYRPAWQAAALLGLPVLHHCQGGFGGPGSGPDAFWLWRKEMFYWGATERFIAASRWLAEGLKGLGIDPARIDVVHNAVDMREWDPASWQGSRVRRSLGVAPDDLVVLCAGRIDPNRQVELLLTAFHKLLGRLPKSLLLLAGRPSLPGYQEQLLKLAEVLGIGERVRFLGFRSDLPALFAAADCAVNPRSNDPFPRGCVEAMAMGVPLLASAGGGLPEMVEDGVSGLLFRPGDPGALAAALERLLRDPAARRRIGGAARRRAAAHFDMKEFVSKVERIWLRLGRTGGRTS